MSGEFTRRPPITGRRQNQTKGSGSNSSASPPISDTKPIPNYLKAPTSSCHDMCKYGHRHNSESKWRPPVRHKQGGKSGIRGVVLNPEPRVSGRKERLKTEEVIIGSISPPKKDIFIDKVATFVEDPKFNAARERIEIEMPAERVFELSDSSMVREIKIYDEEPSVNSSPVRTQDVPIPEESSEDSLSKKLKMLHSDDMHHHALTSDHVLAAEIPLSEDETIMTVETKKNAREVQINGSELHNGKKGQIVRKNTERQKVDKVFLKPSVAKKRESVPKDGTVRKTDVSIQPRPRERIMPLTNNPKASNISIARSQHGESEVKVLKPVKQSTLVKPPMKPLRKLNKCVGPTSSLENNMNSSGGSIPNARNVKVKTLHMIEAKQEVVPARNQAKKGNHKSKLSSASSDSVSDRARTSNKKVVSKSNTKPPPPPHKMAFRRGRVIDVQAETNVPTRIRFRRVKPGNMINRGESGTGVNKVARKKRDGGSIGATASTPPTDTPAVKLRHQDQPQDKSGALRSLFNHVIEETASKLVETRKSKVKALVGAFETVISLQEK
ncbi:Plant calmodulin-binding protein-like protein [Rhynchospora pubera]|uniref:Plant calmodulin-binding protein-like protein n=1 Tax=Rhynchospora pubera TaxID=906938 RepID=A0AAV8F467_9POAL|nr:Plant calmodulin-binding protein-like protein [Rhynchospora pubera]